MDAKAKAKKIFGFNYREINRFSKARFELTKKGLAKKVSIKQVKQIIALPVIWQSKDLEKNNPGLFNIEGTQEFWEEVLTEFKKM